MATNPDSNLSGVPITVSWTVQGADCIPPAFIEALQTANWRVDLPSALSPSGSGITISTLPDNALKLDSSGAAYVPGNTIVTLPSVTRVFDDTMGPGTGIEFAFDAPGVADLQTTFPMVFWDVSPAGAPIHIGPPTIRNNQLVYNLFRAQSAADPSAPWDVITVTGYGSLLIPALVTT